MFLIEKQKHQKKKNEIETSIKIIQTSFLLFFYIEELLLLVCSLGLFICIFDSFAMRLLYILFLLSLVFADVEITSPASGDSFSGSSGKATFDIKWKDNSDDGDSLSLDNVKTYTISLCTGPNGNIDCFSTLVKAQAISDKEYSASISQNNVPNGYYYLQFYTVFDLGVTINYSDRFKLTGMSGSTATVSEAVTDTGDAPAGQTSVASAAINSKSFSITYTLQTGRTKFAPMQLQPGSTITHSTWSRRFPSSTYTVYTSISPSPNAYSTITPGWSYTPVSATNTASSADYPTYFYAASSRVSKATLSAATKRKRWLDL